MISNTSTLSATSLLNIFLSDNDKKYTYLITEN